MIILAIASGLALFLSDHPVHAWPLQLVALVPWLWALTQARSIGRGVGLGFALGVAFAAPYALVFDFPPLMMAALIAYVALLWTVLGGLLAWILRGPAVVSAIAAGAAAVCVEWIDVSLVPIWGTAQVFTRVWSAFPPGIQLGALTGVLGLVFVLVTAQALLVQLARPPRRGPALALVGLVGFVALVSVLGWQRPQAGTLRVAAVGWTFAELSPAQKGSAASLWAEVAAPAVTRAAQAGARLVVLPEAAFFVDGATRDGLVAAVAGLAARLDVTIALGIFHQGSDDNRVVFVTPRGPWAPEYRKTHLIAFLERYRKGDGLPVTVDVDGVRVGALICQDDNFTDLARALGRAGVQVVAVPTNDWRAVKDQHLQSSRFRSVENGLVWVRGASNGISAVVGPRGELLGARDHYATRAGVVVADAPVLPGSGTLYTRFGDWLVWLAAVVTFAGIMAARAAAPSRA